MHLYIRVLLEHGGEGCTSEEQERVRAIFDRAPSVNVVKDVHRHPKGGYAVLLDVEKEALDQLVEYIPANGLRSVF